MDKEAKSTLTRTKQPIPMSSLINWSIKIKGRIIGLGYKLSYLIDKINVHTYLY